MHSLPKIRGDGDRLLWHHYYIISGWICCNLGGLYGVDYFLNRKGKCGFFRDKEWGDAIWFMMGVDKRLWVMMELL